MSSRICMLSAVLLLVVVGTATARYTEMLYYSDAACEDLATRVIVDGTYGELNGSISTFGECTNLTTLNQTYSASMPECVDNEVTVSYFDSDSCSGDALWSGTANTTCSDSMEVSCTEESSWSIMTDWTVDATFYSDENCNTASGVTGEYTMSEVLEQVDSEACEQMDSSTTSSTSSSYTAHRCVDGNIAQVGYSESDTTCSSDFTWAIVFAIGCIDSIFDEGAYMIATCSTTASASSLLVGGGGVYGWSIAAAAVSTVLAAVFG